MTEKQTETKTAVIVQPDLELEEYGRREDIAALARRIKAMVPGGEKLTLNQAMSAAQYAVLVDANIFRGEIYAWVDKRGKLHLTDGYKLLVRWAKRQMPYSEKYTTLEKHLGPDDIGYRCWILRKDAHETLQVLVQARATFSEAYEIAATSAIGVVRKSDQVNRQGKPIAPPHGWTWQQVARKRALKNALNLSHGAPSPREIAAESWKVGDIETTPADWQECTPEMLPAARARLAAMTAHARQQEPDPRTPEEILQENGKVLHGEGDEI